MTHAALLEATRQALARHGYAGTTLARIAAAAGVSRVTLHRRGVSKDGLLGEMIARATDDYRERLWPALTGHGRGAQRLAQSLDALCDAAEEHMELLVALQVQSDAIFHRSEEKRAMLTRTVYTEPLERILRDGVADGSLRDVDPEETATVLFNLVGWSYIHLRTNHHWPAARARGAVLYPVLHGLLDPRAAEET